MLTQAKIDSHFRKKKTSMQRKKKYFNTEIKLEKSIRSNRLKRLKEANL